MEILILSRRKWLMSLNAMTNPLLGFSKTVECQLFRRSQTEQSKRGLSSRSRMTVSTFSTLLRWTESQLTIQSRFLLERLIWGMGSRVGWG
ncbi:hypothetical protein GBA52_021500 [Prunus armeniaca]|nr:hypothetical protein GBA52_021500 [Prunus armeniaca]